MVTVTYKQGRQRKPRFALNAGGDDARQVLAILADSLGCEDTLEGDRDRATMVCEDKTYTAERVR